MTVTMPYDGAVETQEGYWGYDIDMDGHGHGSPMKIAGDASRRSP